LSIRKKYFPVAIVGLLMTVGILLTIDTFNEIKAATRIEQKTQALAKPSLALAPVSLQKSVIDAVKEDKKLASLALPKKSIETATPKPPMIKTVDLTVTKGDTLARLLKRGGVKAGTAQRAVRALGSTFNPKKLQLGQKVTLYFKAEDTSLPTDFTGFGIAPDYATEIRVEGNMDDGFRARTLERAFETKPIAAKATISNSLYLSAKKAGIPDSVIVELIRAFSWDVDFQRDIRKNDGLKVLYSQIYDDKGVLKKSGDIDFASLTLSGKQHTIYRYTNSKNQTRYFDETGASAQKALMRTPINGARLSSRFGKRKHPILGYTKMHKGVDFAAPRGTPIYAAGDGVIVYAGKKGGYGNYVRIRHNQEFNTAYAHMRNVAKKIRKGTRVTQGQIIGYAGSSGRSTGSHLHYEILKKGRQTNPLRVKMPSGKKLTGTELARFQEVRKQIDARYAKASGDDTIVNASR